MSFSGALSWARTALKRENPSLYRTPWNPRTSQVLKTSSKSRRMHSRKYDIRFYILLRDLSSHTTLTDISQQPSSPNTLVPNAQVCFANTGAAGLGGGGLQIKQERIKNILSRWCLPCRATRWQHLPLLGKSGRSLSISSSHSCQRKMRELLFCFSFSCSCRLSEMPR